MADEWLTEERVQAGWRLMDDFATSVQQRCDREHAWPVHRGSQLARDDRRSSPFQTSHMAQSLIHAAADHLHALCSLVIRAQALHTYAGATLARASLETACHAVWLLGSDDRDDRLLRTLRSRAADVRDRREALADFNHDDTSFQPRRDQLRKLATEAKLDIGLALNPVGPTAIMRDSAPYLVARSTTTTMATWRLASGFAHGRTWSSLGFLERDVQDTDDPNILNVRFSMGLDRLLLLGFNAQSALEAAIDLFELRAAAPVPPSVRRATRPRQGS